MSLVLLRKLDNRFQADVWCEALERSGVPYLLRTYQDTAYDSLYVSQKGYASLFVEDAWMERAKQVDQDLESSSQSRPGGRYRPGPPPGQLPFGPGGRH